MRLFQMLTVDFFSFMSRRDKNEKVTSLRRRKQKEIKRKNKESTVVAVLLSQTPEMQCPCHSKNAFFLKIRILLSKQ